LLFFVKQSIRLKKIFKIKLVHMGTLILSSNRIRSILTGKIELIEFRLGFSPMLKNMVNSNVKRIWLMGTLILALNWRSGSLVQGQFQCRLESWFEMFILYQNYIIISSLSNYRNSYTILQLYLSVLKN
jgi:hypothetical protein